MASGDNQPLNLPFKFSVWADPEDEELYLPDEFTNVYFNNCLPNPQIMRHYPGGADFPIWFRRDEYGTGIMREGVIGMLSFLFLDGPVRLDFTYKGFSHFSFEVGEPGVGDV